jgi:hypothetical protein
MCKTRQLQLQKVAVPRQSETHTPGLPGTSPAPGVSVGPRTVKQPGTVGAAPWTGPSQRSARGASKFGKGREGRGRWAHKAGAGRGLRANQRPINGLALTNLGRG